MLYEAVLDGQKVLLSLSPDLDAENPVVDWAEHLPVIAGWHPKYTIGSKDGKDRLIAIVRDSIRYRESWEESVLYGNPHYLNLDEWSELCEALEKIGAIVLPVYMYDHSCLSVSLYPFLCPWDSGQVGVMVWSREQQEKYFCKKIRNTRKHQEQTKRIMHSLFTEWKAYVEGEVYFCELATIDGDVIDCCTGFTSLDKALEYFGIDKAAVQERK